jgi:hypothetical protein
MQKAKGAGHRARPFLFLTCPGHVLRAARSRRRTRHGAALYLSSGLIPMPLLSGYGGLGTGT